MTTTVDLPPAPVISGKASHAPPVAHRYGADARAVVWRAGLRAISTLHWHWARLRGQPAVQAKVLAGWLMRLPQDAQRHATGLGCVPLAALAHAQGECGRWLQAARSWRRVASGGPAQAAREKGRAAARFNQGYCLERLGHVQAARLAFEAALTLNPLLDAAWLGLARVLAQQGQVPDALRALQQHVQLQPWCPDGWVGLVRLQRQLGQTHQAAATLGQLRSFSPRHAMALEQPVGAAPQCLWPDPLP